MHLYIYRRSNPLPLYTPWNYIVQSSTLLHLSVCASASWINHCLPIYVFSLKKHFLLKIRASVPKNQLCLLLRFHSWRSYRYHRRRMGANTNSNHHRNWLGKSTRWIIAFHFFSPNRFLPWGAKCFVKVHLCGFILFYDDSDNAIKSLLDITFNWRRFWLNISIITYIMYCMVDRYRRGGHKSVLVNTTLNTKGSDLNVHPSISMLFTKLYIFLAKQKPYQVRVKHCFVIKQYFPYYITAHNQDSDISSHLRCRLLENVSSVQAQFCRKIELPGKDMCKK